MKDLLRSRDMLAIDPASTNLSLSLLGNHLL